MPIPSHLLERANQLINANQVQNAELVLDAVVRVDPQNMDAWKTYLRIHKSQTDLDWLKERVLKTKELNETAKTELVNYHHYLTVNLNGENEAESQMETLAHIMPREKEKTPAIPQEPVIQFELIDMFDYHSKNARNENRARPRRRTVYNPFTVEVMKRFVKTILPLSLVNQIAIYSHKLKPLIEELVKSPKEFYIKLSEAPHFENYAGGALLTLFTLGVHLIVSNQLFGFVFLILFLIGSGWWLITFGNNANHQSRVFLHENKIKLALIQETQEAKPEKEFTEKISE